MNNKCRICKHLLKNNTTTVELWRGDISIEILDVPARVCPNCGESDVSLEVAERLDQLADAVWQQQAQLENMVRLAFSPRKNKPTPRTTRSSAQRLRGLKVAWG
jgi:YgiT-type zinc finger domain-containing protein